MAFSLIEQLGIAGVLIFPLFFLGRWAVNKIISESHVKQERLITLVEELHAVMLVGGKPFRVEEILKRQGEMNRAIESLLTDDRELMRRYVVAKERLADEDHWKHCELEKCPHLHAVVNTIRDIKACANEFVATGHDSRQRTVDMITGIDQNVKAFANGILALVKQTQDEIQGYAGDERRSHTETLSRLQVIEEQVKLFAAEFINTHRIVLERTYRQSK